MAEEKEEQVAEQPKQKSPMLMMIVVVVVAGLVGGAGLRRAAGDDRSEPQRWPGGVAQLDSSPLSHESLARHGPVDEHAVTALAPHRPPGRGGGHLEVSAGDEGVDDLNVAVR